MSTQMQLVHLTRDVKTALELALAAYAPPDLVDRLAVAAGLLDAFTSLDADAAVIVPLINRTTERAQRALSEWRQWLADHPPKANA